FPAADSGRTNTPDWLPNPSGPASPPSAGTTGLAIGPNGFGPIDIGAPLAGGAVDPGAIGPMGPIELMPRAPIIIGLMPCSRSPRVGSHGAVCCVPHPALRHLPSYSSWTSARLLISVPARAGQLAGAPVGALGGTDLRAGKRQRQRVAPSLPY